MKGEDKIMLCSNCQYKQYTGAETYDTTCYIFGDDVPDDYARVDGEGCRCNRKTLAKFAKENNEAWLNDVKNFVEFIGKEKS